MSSELRKKSVNSLLQLTLTAQNILSRNIVMEGYTQNGQGSPLNFDRIISACTTTVTPSQMEAMKHALIPLVQIMKVKYELTEADMDEYDIVNVNQQGSTDKDKRVLHQRRTVIFSGLPVQQAQADLRVEQASKPGEVAARKEDRRQAKIVKEFDAAKATIAKSELKQSNIQRKSELAVQKQAESLSKQQEKTRGLKNRLEEKELKFSERKRLNTLTSGERGDERLLKAQRLVSEWVHLDIEEEADV